MDPTVHGDIGEREARLGTAMDREAAGGPATEENLKAERFARAFGCEGAAYWCGADSKSTC
eukprot:999027-Pyramimonas_sp.AAC.1